MVLFGSRALGTHRPASDIDLALFGKQLTIGDLISLRSALAELNLPVEIDLLIYDQISNTDLKHHIDTHGKEWC